MNYYEVNFSYATSIDKEVINDILAAELAEVGFESFTENSQGLSAYIKESLYKPEIIEDKISSFPLDDVKIEFTINHIEGKDWNEEWEKNYFKPIIIGKECIIHASFHQADGEYDYNIIIDPKMAFGTGNHETTQLVIRELLDLDVKGKEVLDMGCGTAVLAILATMKGAKRVTAIDIDEWAYENALENIRLNQTNSIEVILGGAEQLPDKPVFDIVIANINRNILLNDIHLYAKCMKKGGLLFMSGFYTEDIPVIEEECKRNGLVLLSQNENNHWAVVKTTLNGN